MYIVSKFHDYYDTAIGYGGVDKSIVYNRKTKYIDIKADSKYLHNNHPYGFKGSKKNRTYYI